MPDHHETNADPSAADDALAAAEAWAHARLGAYPRVAAPAVAEFRAAQALAAFPRVSAPAGAEAIHLRDTLPTVPAPAPGVALRAVLAERAAAAHRLAEPAAAHAEPPIRRAVAGACPERSRRASGSSSARPRGRLLRPALRAAAAIAVVGAGWFGYSALFGGRNPLQGEHAAAPPDERETAFTPGTAIPVSVSGSPAAAEPRSPAVAARGGEQATAAGPSPVVAAGPAAARPAAAPRVDRSRAVWVARAAAGESDVDANGTVDVYDARVAYQVWMDARVRALSDGSTDPPSARPPSAPVRTLLASLLE